MPTRTEYLDYILDQLRAVEGISSRAMMGEYILYCRNKIFGGIYDDRLLVKDTPAAARMMPRAPRELPYPGAKPMLLVEDVDNPDFLSRLLAAMWPELPAPKRKRSPEKA